MLPMRFYHTRLCLSALALVSLSGVARSSSSVNINVAMMEATCKITGSESTGTGFLVGTPVPDRPDRYFYTLVTANHVLDGVKGDRVQLLLRRLLDREKQSYQRVEATVPIRNGTSQLWTKHPAVDLAAMFVSLPEGAAPAVIPMSLVLTDDEIQKFELSAGVELCCLGYPFGAESSPVGFPILRSGRIASYPLLPTAGTKSFLFDFSVFRGNSGGPVYLYQSNPTFGGSTQLGTTIQGLVGVVTSERSVTQKIEQLYEKRETVTPLVLGEVIHASFIKELIGSMPLPKTE